LDGKYQKMGYFKGAKMVEKAEPKLGKFHQDFPWIGDQ